MFHYLDVDESYNDWYRRTGEVACKVSLFVLYRHRHRTSVVACIPGEVACEVSQYLDVDESYNEWYRKTGEVACKVSLFVLYRHRHRTSVVAWETGELGNKLSLFVLPFLFCSALKDEL
jgi:hypothetical protein